MGNNTKKQSLSKQATATQDGNKKLCLDTLDAVFAAMNRHWRKTVLNPPERDEEPFMRGVWHGVQEGLYRAESIVLNMKDEEREVAQ